MGFCRKPFPGLVPGAFEQITLTVGFQVVYTIPFAVGIKNIGVVGVAVEFNVLYARKVAYQRLDGTEMGQKIIHVRCLKFHSYDSYDHGGLSRRCRVSTCRTITCREHVTSEHGRLERVL